MTAVAAPQKHKFAADEGEPSSVQCVAPVLPIHFSAALGVLIDAGQEITPYVNNPIRPSYTLYTMHGQ